MPQQPIGFLALRQLVMATRSVGAVVIDEEVARDGQQPSPRARPIRVEASPRAERPLERELCQVLGLLARAQPVTEESVDAPHLIVIKLRGGGRHLPVHRAKPSGQAVTSARGRLPRTNTYMQLAHENADTGRGAAALRAWPLGSATRWLALDRLGPFLGGWLLPFALVLYLGLKGGGYDQVVYGQVGIVVWWIVVLGAAVAVVPVSRIGTAAWIGFGLLAAFAAWTALGVGWSGSA